VWSSTQETLTDGRAVKFVIEHDSAPVSYSEVIDRWQKDAQFCGFITGLLKDSPFGAFRWETPPVTRASANRPFEFVLLDSPYLAVNPDPGAFAEHFDAVTPGGVVEFYNLGRDAILVAPCPQHLLADYGHFAAFLRHSPDAQQRLLWRVVGAAMQRRLDSRPVWLSTAGGGVDWLHVRLDDYPKYYGYAPYRDFAWYQE
jgi:hypothetical protein